MVTCTAGFPAPSNSPGAALVGELESISFDVDNTAPTVTVSAPRRDGSGFVVPFEVRDADSAPAGEQVTRVRAEFPDARLDVAHFERVRIGQFERRKALVLRFDP